MAYRGEDAGGVLEAPTATGTLSVSLGANRLTLVVGPLSLHLADRTATVTKAASKRAKARRTSFTIRGLVYGRGYPRDDIGLWVEATQDVEKGMPRASLRRIFGIEPASLLEPTGLRSLAKLETVAARLRTAAQDYAHAAGIWFARGTEIGAGHALDKVLLADHDDHHAVYARRLFRDRARLLATVHRDGRVIVHDGVKKPTEVSVPSRFGVTVRGDHIRFADRHGIDLARISVPWVGPEDRQELARRLGQLVHRG